MMLARGNANDLTEAFVLEACGEIIDRAPAEVADAVVPKILYHDSLATVGFVRKADALVRTKARNYQVRRLGGANSSLFDIRFDVPKEYFEALHAMYDALFDALDLPETQAVGDDPMPRVLLHLSALVEASQMMKVPASDVWGWLRPFDHEATRAVLRGFIGVSGLDWDKLRKDAMHAKRYLNTEVGSEDVFLSNVTTPVDPPPIDWSRAKFLGLDARLIETAVAHPSEWIKPIAVNLLLVLLDPGALADVVRRLLDTGRDLTLWAAGRLAARRQLS